MDRHEIRRRYARTWALPDMLSSFPVEIVALIASGLPQDQSSSLTMLRLVRIAKLPRLLKLLKMELVNLLKN